MNHKNMNSNCMIIIFMCQIKSGKLVHLSLVLIYQHEHILLNLIG